MAAPLRRTPRLLLVRMLVLTLGVDVADMAVLLSSTLCQLCVCSLAQGDGQCETTLDGLASLSAQPLRLEVTLR